MGAKKLNPKIQQMGITCFWGGARLVFCREWWGGFLFPGGSIPDLHPTLACLSVTKQTSGRISFHLIQYWRKEKAIVPYESQVISVNELSKTYPIIVILAAGIILSNFQEQKTV